MRTSYRFLAEIRSGASVAHVVVLEGNGAGQKCRLDGPVTLGRSLDATITVDDPGVSRLHARVTPREDGGFLLEDLGSTNGTFINGAPCERTLLTYGDKVGIGPRCVFEISNLELPVDQLSRSSRVRVANFDAALMPRAEVARPSVLLVDDERTLRRGVARLLRKAGYEVTEAADGVEAVANYESARFDLVLMDLEMPGMNGEETYARLVALDPHVRVVFATGYADPVQERVMRARGALAVLQKPFGFDALLTLLRGLLDPAAHP